MSTGVPPQGPPVSAVAGHATEYGIDPDAIAAGGFSAGTVTALNLAYMPGQQGPATSRIAAALPAAGLLMDQPDPGEPPSIIFHATGDTELPVNNGDTVCPLVEPLGIACELVEPLGIACELVEPLGIACELVEPLGIACELVAYDGAGHSMRPRDVIRRGTDFLVEHVLEPAGHLDVAADGDRGDRAELPGTP